MCIGRITKCTIKSQSCKLRPKHTIYSENNIIGNTKKNINGDDCKAF